MPELTLTPDEIRELKHALDQHLHNLRFELARADMRDFRDHLRERIGRLEAIAAQLAKS